VDIVKYGSPEYKELIGRSVMVRKRVASTVSKIIDEVRDRGDAAVMELTKKFDGASFKRAKDMSVGEREISASFRDLDATMILSIKRAIDNSEERVSPMIVNKKIINTIPLSFVLALPR
jgi:histidinol dehydrogenase